MGHSSRSIALAREFAAAGHEVHFGAYGYSRDFIGRKGFKTSEIPPEITIAGEGGDFNAKNTITATFKNWEYIPSRWGLVELRRLLEKERPDVIISDTYFMGVLSAKLQRIACYIILNQSNVEEYFKDEGLLSIAIAAAVKFFSAFIFRLADGIIIPDFHPPHTICRKNLFFNKNMAKKLFFSGPLPGRTSEETTAEELKHPHVLCSIGGFGHREPIFTKVIETARMDDSINYTLLSGPSVQPSDFQPVPDNVKILGFIDDQFPYLKACDLVIAPGGHSTMMEALSFGIPMITLPDLNHSEQQNNASVIEEDGLGIKLDYSTSAEEILESIGTILNDEKYKSRLEERKSMVQEMNGPEAIRLLLEEKFK